MEFIATAPVDVWKAATVHLVGHKRSDFNLRLEFLAVGAIDEQPLLDHDPKTVLGSGHDVARDVANTIFPAKTWRKSPDRAAFYSRYLRANRRRAHGHWGTYFERMVAFGPERINQLERVIIALRAWQNTPKAALNLHLSSAAIDNLRPIGAPCLQYVQFCCEARDSVSLSAVYRNHDYTNKVLGNLFGLSRLLAFVAQETGRRPDRISVLSTHAYIDASIRNQKRLAHLA